LGLFSHHPDHGQQGVSTALNFLDSLAPAERKAFTAVAMEQSFPRGAVLMREGEQANYVMVILRGWVRITARDIGGERVVAERGPGQLVGERGVLRQNVRSATVTALSEVSALVMKTEDFASFISSHPRVLDVVENQIYDRLTEDPDGYAQRGWLGALSRRGISRALRASLQPLWLTGENCTVLMTDVVGFGALHRSDYDRQIIRREGLEIMQASLGPLWDECISEDRGDGLLVVVPPQVPAARIIEGINRELPGRLRLHNRTYSGSARIHLRVAVTVGPVTGDPLGLSGETIIRAARLVEAPVLKEAMAATGAGLGIVVSDFVYGTAIRHVADFIDATEYKKVEVRNKEFRGSAWMRLTDGNHRSALPASLDIPHPADALVPAGGPDRDEEAEPARAASASGNGTHGHSGQETGGDGPGGSGKDHGPERPAGGPPVRYLTGSVPERAPGGRRISLQVQITLARLSGASARLRPLDVPQRGCEVTITVTAPGLIPLGDLEQDIHVPAAADSDPIRFGFTTGRVGLHSVLVRAYAAGTFLGELTLRVSVEAGTAIEEGPARSAVLADLTAEPGEVTLQVSRTDDDRYSFQLIGEALYPVELTRRLAGDPTEVVAALVQELQSMAAQESPYADPALARNRLRNLGAQLWADVVPESIRRQFWAQAQAGRIKLFTVASDMDVVPWELLYPVDGDNDNGFLVEQFPVVRRVYGQGRVRHLNLSSAAYIIPPGSPANAMDEVAAVRACLGNRIRDHGVCSRLDSLIGLLEDSPGLLHFACHNAFTETAGSVITLDGGPLRPSDLAVAVQAHRMAAAAPLVFLNACRTAGEIHGLVHMIGWARQFMAAGAGAFVGSLWPVRSSSAKTFADTFYHALVADRQSLGSASLRARQAIASDNGDPTWLAYTIYGNPSATVGAPPSRSAPS
jgi:CRP-like cAMP-binding protein